jgi:hypothetical protein
VAKTFEKEKASPIGKPEEENLAPQSRYIFKKPRAIAVMFFKAMPNSCFLNNVGGYIMYIYFIVYITRFHLFIQM